MCNRANSNLSLEERKAKIHNRFRSFLIVHLVLYFMGVINGYNTWWIPMTILWGLSIAIDSAKVYGYGFWSKEWEEKMLEKEMQQMEEEEGFFSAEPRQNSWNEQEIV